MTPKETLIQISEVFERTRYLRTILDEQFPGCSCDELIGRLDIAREEATQGLDTPDAEFFRHFQTLRNLTL